MSSSRVVRVHARDEVAAQSLRDGISRIQSELEVTPDFAPEVEAAATARGRESAAARPRPHGHRVRHDRPARPRWTSTRRSTSSARAPATSCTTRSPTSRAFVAAGRPDRRRLPRARRDALRRRLQGPPAPDRRCPRVRPRCCPTRCARRCSGPSTSTRPVRAPTSTSSGPGCGRGRSSTTIGVQQAVDDGTADEVLMLLKEVGELRLHREAARGGISLPAARAGGRGRPATSGRWSSAR